MNCKECYDFLMDYLDGELPEAQRAAFEMHLQACPPCVQYLETYKMTLALARTACTSDDAPAEKCIPEELIRAILEARTR